MGLEVGVVASHLELSEKEVRRYLDIGLIKIRPLEEMPLADCGTGVGIQFGNKVLIAEFCGDRVVRYDMRYLRGKRSST
jgi:hypothetical protein